LLYVILAHYNLVSSIDDFLNLTFAQTELLLTRLTEFVEEINRQMKVGDFR